MKPIHASIVIHDDEYVLIQFRPPWFNKYPLHFSYWGGGIEKIADEKRFETPIEAIFRELEEEIKLVYEYLSNAYIGAYLIDHDVFEQEDVKGNKWFEQIYSIKVPSIQDMMEYLRKEKGLITTELGSIVEEGYAVIFPIENLPNPMIANFKEITNSILKEQSLDDKVVNY
tara:strand:- start:1301 stop:1813 length:513 start_codon:yes stop_codon:yes gene_type:complete